ncbi:MAG: hypothetical protein VB858_16900 [Planctomycetaceae bacterium]
MTRFFRSKTVAVCLAGVFLWELCLTGIPCPALADEVLSQKHPLSEAGPKAGSTIHPFFVRAVTGPHRNRSVCYVCRYGSRPVVMVLVQEVDPKLGTLLTTIDQIIDQNRLTGLRGFGVLVTDQSAQAVPILQTIAFDRKVHMPLTAATTSIAGSSSHNLHPDAATTLILYRNQKAVETISLKSGQITSARVSSVTQQIRKFIKR